MRSARKIALEAKESGQPAAEKRLTTTGCQSVHQRHIIRRSSYRRTRIPPRRGQLMSRGGPNFVLALPMRPIGRGGDSRSVPGTWANMPRTGRQIGHSTRGFSFPPARLCNLRRTTTCRRRMGLGLFTCTTTDTLPKATILHHAPACKRPCPNPSHHDDRGKNCSAMVCGREQGRKDPA